MVSYSLITGPRAAASCSAAPLLGEPLARIQKLNEPAEVMATPSGDLTPLANSGTLPLVVHDGVVPQDLLDESSDFLMSLLDAATTGKRQLVGKTLLDPKKDSKWERGRTRHAMHFGAHVRGGRAVGAEVEEIPACLLEVAALLRGAGCLQSPTHEGDETPNAREGSAPESVVAVTIDFFRRGSYTPALAATAPLLDPSSKVTPENVDARKGTGVGFASESGRAANGRSNFTGDEISDTESKVCMVWLQGGGDVVIGSPQELARCSKGVLPPGEKTTGADGGTNEGVFFGMGRLSVPQGSAMVWDGSQVGGVQVAVPTAASDRLLVSFQTLTPEASSHVLRNRLERKQAKAKAASIRRAAKEAKEAKAKGPIPGTPIVVAEWREDGGGELAAKGNAGSVKGNEGGAAGNEGNSGDNGGDGGDDGGKTPSIEREHVQAVYDTIAPHWSHTRYKPWPKVEEFLSKLEAFSLVADAGCGNGKYLGCDAAGGYLLGSDASVNLLNVCKERLPEAEVLASDCMRLPFRSGVFDAAISIAVLHHFSSEARRLRALSELCRLLRPGGRVLVYAWAIEQDQDSRRSFAAQDVLVPWHLADHHTQDRDTSINSGIDHETTDRLEQSTSDTNGVQHPPPKRPSPEENGSLVRSSALPPSDSGNATAPCGNAGSDQMQHSRDSSRDSALRKPGLRGVAESKSGEADGVVSAPTPSAPKHGVRVDGLAGGSGSVVYQRYCHVYVEGELEGLVESVDGLRLIESYYDRSNWCVVAERVVETAV